MKFDDVLNYIEKLPYTTFKDVALHYANAHKVDVADDLDNIAMTDLQKRLDKLGVNTVCPKCGSEHVVKNGKRKHIQRYKCKSCNKQFTLFTNTIMEKTKFHWNVWIKVTEMILNNYSIEHMRSVLIKDYGFIGIDHKTVFLWKHKIVHALAEMPQPTLSGIVQVDETFVREAQKGSRKLVSYIDRDDVREPRYGRKPSKYGIMGAEFATITTAIDNTGHCVCKVTGLGRLTPDVFTDEFEKHFVSPAYLCTDANPIYQKFSKVMNIPHYERPSNYLETLKKDGYESPSRVDDVLAEKQRQSNEVIKSKLYEKGLIDKLTNRGYVPYEEFKALREMNNLNLARVNQLHADIKKLIYGDMTNVSTKYLSDYIGYFTFVKNWSVDNSSYPSSRQDAEKILIEILKHQGTYTITDLKNTELTLPKPSPRYMTLLKAHTEEARKFTNNKYFKFDEEDKVVSFDKRNYLLEIPEVRIKNACKYFSIKYKRKWVRWTMVTEILRHPKINEIIIYLIDQDKAMKMYQEDIEYLEKEKYRDSSTA
jgi:transposase-like protein